MSATMQFIYIHTMYPLRCVTWSSEYHDEWKQDGRERPCVVHFLSLGPIDLFPFFLSFVCISSSRRISLFSLFFRFTNVSNLLLANVLHVCTYITRSSGPTTFIYVNDDEEGKGKFFSFPLASCIRKYLAAPETRKYFTFPFSLCPLCGCKYFVLSGSFIFNSFSLNFQTSQIDGSFSFQFRLLFVRNFE